MVRKENRAAVIWGQGGLFILVGGPWESGRTWANGWGFARSFILNLS